MPWEAATPTPIGWPSQIQPLGTTVFYSLTDAQIAFILARMAVGTPDYTVGQIRLGLAASAVGFPTPLVGDPPNQVPGVPDDVRIELDIVGPTAVPEPGTMLLLASGMVAAGLRRLRRPPR